MSVSRIIINYLINVSTALERQSVEGGVNKNKSYGEGACRDIAHCKAIFTSESTSEIHLESTTLTP